MKRCAFLTMESLEGFFANDDMARAPLAELGWQLDEVPWTAADVPWDDYDVVVIRSPWDYQDDPPRFLEVLERIDRSRARLENGLEIVRWNIEKTYLRDLEDRGVRIVPTRWPTGLTREGIAALRRELGAREVIVKPIIGANADGTFRLGNDTSPEVEQEACRLFDGRELIAQPFVDSVIEVGEFSLFYFAGEYSHCVLKTPTTGDFRVQEEHGGVIRSATPDDDMLVAGQRAIEAIGTTLLYARVDLVRLPDGTPALMELELIEPSLYFPYDADSPKRFALALDRLSAS